MDGWMDGGHLHTGRSVLLTPVYSNNPVLVCVCRFEALVEREWLQAGHPFADRCAKSAFAVSKQRSESPVFLLFLDSVWQIWQQFPCSFEFNEDFLITLFKHSYASQFGEIFVSACRR